MPEYIEREKLIKNINNFYCKPCKAENKDYNQVACRACWVNDMQLEIEDEPAADVAVVKHGKWIGSHGDRFAWG